MTEDEFWDTHTVLTNELEATEDSYFVVKELNAFAGRHPRALQRMNRRPLFWTATAHAHRTTFVITIGRIFDQNPKSHSIHRLLREAARHPEFFSREALRRRKLAASPTFDPKDLDKYVAQAWEPDGAALEAFRTSFQPTTDIYERSFRLIRHKLYAHQDVLSKAAIQALVSKGLSIDFEQILYGVHDALSCLLQLGINGIEPVLGQSQYGFEDRIRLETRAMLEDTLIKEEDQAIPERLPRFDIGPEQEDGIEDGQS